MNQNKNYFFEILSYYEFIMINLNNLFFFFKKDNNNSLGNKNIYLNKIKNSLKKSVDLLT